MFKDIFNICEIKIKTFEDYVRDFIFDDKRIGLNKNETSNRIYYKNIDYQKFKKYLLSILWRASVSSIQMFSKIKLIEADEDKIRSILMNRDTCEPYFFGCEIIEFYNEEMEKLNKKIDYKTILMQPFLYKHKLKNFIFVYAGYIWKYYLNDVLLLNETLKTNMLNTSGNMIVLKKSIYEYPILIDSLVYSILKSNKVGKFGKNS